MSLDGPETPRLLEITIERTDGEVAVVLAGEIDVAMAPRLESCLADLRERGERTVIVDLAGVTFIDSTGLHVLVSANNRLRQDGGSVVLRSPQERVGRLLDMTGLRERFEVR